MLFILGSTIITYSITLTVISLNLKKNFTQEGKELLDSRVLQMANDIKSKMNKDISIAKSLASIIVGFSDYPEDKRIEAESNTFHSIINSHPEYEAVWMSWELSVLKPDWKKANGRRRYTLFRKENSLQETIEVIDTVNKQLTGFYYKMRNNPQLLMSEPYVSDDYEAGMENSLWITSPCIPLMKNGQFAGLLGTDYSMKEYTELAMLDHSLYHNAYSFMISNEGTLVAHSEKPTSQHSSIDSLGFAHDTDIDLHTAVRNGHNEHFTTYDPQLGESVYVSLAPVLPRDAVSPWSVGIAIPSSELIAPYLGTLRLTVILGVVGLMLLSIITFLVSISISRPIEATNKLLKAIASGNLRIDDKIEAKGAREIKEMAQSVNALMNELHSKAKLATEIGKGNLHAAYHLQSENDELGTALLKMKDNLKAVIVETEGVVAQASEDGKLDIRIATDNKEGAWKDLSKVINGLLESFSSPLIVLNKIIDEMAKGDLTHRYTNAAHGDIEQMANSLNSALDKINGVLSEVVDRSEELGSSMEEMLLFNEDFSMRTDEIGVAISEVSRGVQDQANRIEQSFQLTEKLQQSALHMEADAKKINETAKKGAKNSEEGMGMIKEVKESIQEISQFAHNTTSSIQVLTERSKEIERVLGVITEIAAQTNLLALNAAIEAAQAGDAGRGFAVVADEIRTLAENSKNSAREIEGLVKSVQEDTKKASLTISEMNTRVQSGEETANSAAGAFGLIQESSKEALELTEDIILATTNQLAGINDVFSITENIVVISEQTTSSTERINSTAVQISNGMVNQKNKTEHLVDITQAQQEHIRQIKILDPKGQEA